GAALHERDRRGPAFAAAVHRYRTVRTGATWTNRADRTGGGAMTLLRKLLPAPLLSAALFLVWIALARSVTPGQVLLGLALALVVPIRTARMRLTDVWLRKPLVIVNFIVVVVRDVLVSNLEVGFGVLTWWRRKPEAKFVVIPLELGDP